MSDSLLRLTAALADRYRIERELGQGGMATVYLAEDLRHKRKVALKVLKPELAAVLGAERFVQEITTTASLQHPHILPLFDSGTADGFLFYVMPYIQGETLRTKLDRETQLGIDEAVRLTREVADALDYAHRHGIIHRDIKPENILLHDGRSMVADFGIALAVSAAAGGRMTETGLSLGTPHYMSPEQATAEKELTNRSDIYSLGCVLYEMLTGSPPHVGATAQQIVMKIVMDVARPVTELRKSVPPNVAAAASQALEKLPADRFESAKAFAEALGNPAFHATTAAASAARGTASGSGVAAPKARIAMALSGVAIAALAYLAGRSQAPLPPFSDVGLPDTAQFAFADASPWGTEWPSLVVSPEGDFIVYVARRGPDTELWYRSLSGGEVRPLPGTRGGYQPAISPDGRSIAFISGRLLKRVAVDGMVPAVDMAEVVEPYGIMWADSDEVLVASDFGNTTEWIRVSDGRRDRIGGPCAWPARVPGRNDLLCASTTRTRRSCVVPLAEDGTVPLSPGACVVLGDSSRAVGMARSILVGDQLLWMDQAGNLLAARYDAERRTVGPQRVVQRGLRRSLFVEMGHFGLTRGGDLVFVPGSNGAIGEFVAMRPGGAVRALPIPVKEHLNFATSRDGRRIAATALGVSGSMELWIYEVETGQGDRVITGGTLGYPAWATDGTLAFVFGETQASEGATMLLRPGAAAPGRLQGGEILPGDFAAERTLVGNSPTGVNDIVVAVLDGDRLVPTDTLRLPGNQYYPQVSPDGRWVTYAGAEKGISQVFVTPFPSLDRQFKVSTDVASEPVWLSDGGLVYRIGSCWYQLRPRAGSIPPFGAPVQIHCDDRFLNTSGLSNTTMPDGSLLYLRTVRPTTGGYVRIIRNWRKAMLESGTGDDGGLR